MDPISKTLAVGAVVLLLASFAAFVGYQTLRLARASKEKRLKAFGLQVLTAAKSEAIAWGVTIVVLIIFMCVVYAVGFLAQTLGALAGF